jgi:hypothetical protein
VTIYPRVAEFRGKALAFIALLVGLFVFVGVAVAGAPTNGGASGASKASVSPTPPGCVRTWNIVDNPSTGSMGATLKDVQALSSTDVWAVGDTSESGVIEHWNGTAWTAVWGTAALNQSRLFDVSALSANDVWVAGATYTEWPSGAGLVMHWDGASWQSISTPASSEWHFLTGVDARAANDVWVVGKQHNVSEPFAMHWDGTTWTVLPEPTVPNLKIMHKVAAVGANDVWVAGLVDAGDDSETVMLHWNGSAWRVGSSFPGEAWSMARLSSGDIWAVTTGSWGSPLPSLVLHWDGTTWSQVWSYSTARFYGISALSNDDVWVAGFTESPSVSVVAHWDGDTWQTMPSPWFSPGGGQFIGIAAVSSDEVWAVGLQGSRGAAVTARYQTTCPQPVVCATGWNVIESLDPDPNLNILFGADATAPNDVWAVGASGDGATPYVKRWNGDYWGVMPGTSVPEGSILQDVSVASASDAWAVGYYQASADRPSFGSGGKGKLIGENGRLSTPLWSNRLVAVHWDGQAWSQVTVPVPGAQSGNALNDVAAIAPNDVWAVGYYNDQGTYEGAADALERHNVAALSRAYRSDLERVGHVVQRRVGCGFDG